MRKCEVAVLGLGLMGGAALNSLLDAGVDALGFDPVAAGSDRGSSHGSCRIFRRFNFENPNYTSLSDEAHAGWIRLQAESGDQLPILPNGLLETENRRLVLRFENPAHQVQQRPTVEL